MFINKSFNVHKKWWVKEIPCLHRLHDSIPHQGAHKIQNELGMSISLQELESKLNILSNRVSKSNDEFNLQQKALVTFDDGHKDILLAVPILSKFPIIQPVLFLTGPQLNNVTLPLPLTALYTWCGANNLDPNDLEHDYGFNRKSLKLLPEEEQRNILKKHEIDISPVCEEMLSLNEVRTLVSKGWLIGYHGSSHCDLRIYSNHELKDKFDDDLLRLKELRFSPWIAWPEGRWNDSLSAMAYDVGFDLQFGLEGEKKVGTKEQCLNRKIWK